MEVVKTFSIKGAINWGWKNFKERPWFYVGITLLVFVINISLQGLADKDFVENDIIAALAGLLGTVVVWWIHIGFIGMLLSIYSGETGSVSQLFEQEGKTLWHYALATILYTLIILGGIILFIVPGIIWAIKFQYYAYFIVEKGMKPVEALKQSAFITDGHKWTLAGFILLLGLINLLGVLVLLVGLLATIPISLLAMVYVYKWLDKNTALKVESTEN